MGQVRRISRGDRVIHWIEQYCRVPSGKDVGKPVKLRPFQKKVIRQIYREKPPVRRAIITVGRKNAKTALSAFLLLAHLAGPEALPNSELYSTAQSRDQAAIIFRLAAKTVRLSPELSSVITIRDTAKQLACLDLGTLYSALSSEATTAFGLSPVFVVHDELGQVRGPRFNLYEAMETATGAQAKPLTLIISTQAPTDNDLLSILIDDAKTGEDESTVLFMWEADLDADPFSEETIRQANPAFGDFQNAEETMRMADAARRMPSREADFRNYVLNQRIEAYNPFVTRSVWAENAAEPKPPTVQYGGLDLSETKDLTALILVSPDGDYRDVECFFWLPSEGLRERAHEDRVKYDVWYEQGFLKTTPGKSVDYDYVAEFLVNLIKTRDIRKIAFDRYNMRHLRPWLVRHGLSEEVIDSVFVDFGQGFVSMSPALRNLEGALLNGRVRHGDHPVLKMCAANAVVKRDEAGNRKLDKAKSRGRIDGLQALAMANSVLTEDLHEEKVLPVELASILE